MKKIFILVLFTIFAHLTYGQFTINQSIGSNKTLVTSLGGLKADSAFMLPVFTDTASANRSQYVKFYAGNMIRVGDTLYVRNSSATKWLNVGSGGISITSGYGISSSPNPITSFGTIKLDTATLSLKYLRISDTSKMLTPYLRKTDTASLSNRINLRVQYADTSSMLNPYLLAIDTSSLSSRINLKIDSIRRSSDSIYAYRNGTRVFQYKDSTGGGTGTVTSIATGYGLSGGTITTSGTLSVDSATLSAKYVRIADTSSMLNPYLRKIDTASLSNRINLKVNISDTASMLNPYLRKIDTASLSNRINLKVNISDTSSMLSPYLRKIDTASLSNRINLKLNISDTASMLTPYLRKIDTTSMLSHYFNNVNYGLSKSGQTISVDTSKISTLYQTNLRVKYTDTASMLTPYLRKIDTTNKWVNNITRTAGKDSIIYYIGSTRYAIKDSVGANPAPVGYYGAWQDNNTQTAAASNVGYPMIFRTVDLENQVRVVTNGTNLTRITFDNTGIYNLQFSSQFQNTSNQLQDVTIWLRKNGVDVPGSSGYISVPNSHGGVDGHIVVSWNYLLSIVGGEYYEIVWSTTLHTAVTMQYYAAGNPPPSTASVIATVTQQSGIMAGTGITAINSLTKSVQTLVTGTSGTDFNISSVDSIHTFNLPTASATNRGALSSANWTTFNSKISPSDTASMLTNYINLTNYGLSKSGQTVSADTSKLSTLYQTNLRLKISDTAAMLSPYTRQKDTIPMFVFGAGSGATGDTAAFSTSAIYGAFYNDFSDTIIVTSFRIGLQGTSPSINATIYFNDSLAVTAGATKIVNAGNTATNIYTGTSVTSLDNTKIPPGNWVWVQTGTVTTKPTFFILTLFGYKSRR